MRRQRISVGAALCAAGLAACVVDETGGPGAKDTAAGVPDAHADPARPPDPDAARPLDLDPADGAAPATVASSCDPSADDACRDHGGLCVPPAPGASFYACAGQLGYTGHDDDDDVLYVGDTSQRSLAFEADADVFRIAAPAGRWRVLATPVAGVDLALDVHDGYGVPIGAFDDGVAGAPEGITWTMTDGLGGFVVARHVGEGFGRYAISVAPADEVLP